MTLMTITRPLPFSHGEFALKLGIALLMVFASTLALVGIEVCLALPQSTADFANIMF